MTGLGLYSSLKVYFPLMVPVSGSSCGLIVTGFVFLTGLFVVVVEWPMGTNRNDRIKLPSVIGPFQYHFGMCIYTPERR